MLCFSQQNEDFLDPHWVEAYHPTVSSCLSGWLREISGGTATVVSDFKELRPEGPKAPKDRSRAELLHLLIFLCDEQLQHVAAREEWCADRQHGRDLHFC